MEVILIFIACLVFYLWYSSRHLDSRVLNSSISEDIIFRYKVAREASDIDYQYAYLVWSHHNTIDVSPSKIDLDNIISGFANQDLDDSELEIAIFLSLSNEFPTWMLRSINLQSEKYRARRAYQSKLEAIATKKREAKSLEPLPSEEDRYQAWLHKGKKPKTW